MNRGTMRGVLALAIVVSSAASDGPKCELNSADAVNEAINAALAIWASTKRCNDDWAPVTCEQDIATSIQSVTAMGSAIAGMVQSCGSIQTGSPKCGIAANDLVSATAGLTAAAGGIAQHCADVSGGKKTDDVLGLATQLGKCVAGASGSMNSVFQASNSLQKIKATCGTGSKGCTASAMDVTSVFAAFGAYIAGAVNDCSTYEGNTVVSTHQAGQADCANAVLGAVASLTGAANAGLRLSHACSSGASRLYLDGKSEATTSMGSPLTLALAAIPVAAVVSFLGGLRFAKSRQTGQTRYLEVSEQGVEMPITA